MDKFKDIDDSMKKQYSINFISNEYKSLGIDLENLQMKYLFKTGTMMVLLSLFIMVVIILTTYLSGKIAAMFAFDLREKASIEFIIKVTGLTKEEIEKLV